jgi:hypothetical protein
LISGASAHLCAPARFCRRVGECPRLPLQASSARCSYTAVTFATAVLERFGNTGLIIPLPPSTAAPASCGLAGPCWREPSRSNLLVMPFAFPHPRPLGNGHHEASEGESAITRSILQRALAVHRREVAPPPDRPKCFTVAISRGSTQQTPRTLLESGMQGQEGKRRAGIAIENAW